MKQLVFSSNKWQYSQVVEILQRRYPDKITVTEETTDEGWNLYIEGTFNSHFFKEVKVYVEGFVDGFNEGAY